MKSSRFLFQIFASAFDLVFTFSFLSRQCRYKRGHSCEKYSVFHSQPSRSDLNCSFSSLSTPSACVQLDNLYIFSTSFPVPTSLTFPLFLLCHLLHSHLLPPMSTFFTEMSALQGFSPRKKGKCIC